MSNERPLDNDAGSNAEPDFDAWAERKKNELRDRRVHKMSSREVSEAMFARCENSEPISLAEYRRLSLWGMAALIRETESTAYRLKELIDRRQRG